MCWELSPASAVQESAAGLLLGSFGYVGDELEHVQIVVNAMRSYSGARAATMLAEQATLSECFTRWDTLNTQPITGGIVWTAFADGLRWALADTSTREQLFSGFRGFRGRRQWLVLEVAPPAELRAALADVGVALHFASPEQVFLVEVTGPDGRALASVVDHAEPEAALAPVAAGSKPMLHAAKLKRKLESAVGAATPLPVFEALLGHPGGLLLRSNPQGEVSSMRFPHDAEAVIAVYPDTGTFARADRELGCGESRAMACMEPRTLLDWVRDLNCGLAVGWYNSEDKPIRYLTIPKGDLEILCNGALPRQYSIVDHVRMACGLKPRAARWISGRSPS